jgi:hypothetical protein
VRLLALLLCGMAVGKLAPLVSAPTTKSRLTEIRIPLWMESRTAAGNHEAGDYLAPKDLRATLDGKASLVLDVKCPNDDLIILMVLDLSSGDLTVADPAKDALAAEIRKLPPNTYVGLLRAQDRLQVLLDPTADRDAVIHAIQQQTLSGKTGLLSTVDIIGRIADAMLKQSAVRVAIVYVTDGDVRNYREDFANPVINASDSHDLSRRFPETLVQEKIAKLETTLAMQQTPLFIVNLSQRGDRLNEAYQNGMKQLAETTAGMAFFSRSTTEIPGVIQKSLETIASHYSVTLALPERVSPRLQIHLATPETDRTLSYRTRLVLKEK